MSRARADVTTVPLADVTITWPSFPTGSETPADRMTYTITGEGLARLLLYLGHLAEGRGEPKPIDLGRYVREHFGASETTAHLLLNLGHASYLLGAFVDYDDIGDAVAAIGRTVMDLAARLGAATHDDDARAMVASAVVTIRAGNVVALRPEG